MKEVPSCQWDSEGASVDNPALSLESSEVASVIPTDGFCAESRSRRLDSREFLPHPYLYQPTTGGQA